jgi:hypothetical protein
LELLAKINFYRQVNDKKKLKIVNTPFFLGSY